MEGRTMMVEGRKVVVDGKKWWWRGEK